MKRKLSDLKDNECIKVNTLREAKYFCYKGNWIIDRPNPKEIKGEFIVFVEPNVIAWNRSDGLSKKELSNILPASDFIKPKKSNLKKVWQEIARMDGRIADLEADKTKLDLVEGLECEAEIIKEKGIDWSVPQLVENEHGTVWYLIEENKTDKKYFVGVCLLLNGVKQFRYSEEIFKTNIKSFNGSICLKNE